MVWLIRALMGVVARVTILQHTAAGLNGVALHNQTPDLLR